VATSTSSSTTRASTPFGPTADASQDDFDAVYNINVKAPFFLVSALAPQMAERGKGAIVNIATMVAHYARPATLYGSSKAAVLLLTKAWAAEYGTSGVRVNAISPGPTRTEGTSGFGDALDQLPATTPHGRPGLPEEIAAAVTFLVSDDAAYIHGAQLPVDGGRIAV
jgi:NAD(P)-dependent dehydrogenase (short-subunit alcohol dehydrogenase family)